MIISKKTAKKRIEAGLPVYAETSLGARYRIKSIGILYAHTVSSIRLEINTLVFYRG